MSAADRIEAFLDRRAQMSGLDAEEIIGVADVDRGQPAGDIMLRVTTSDLRELVEKARLADAVRASRSVQRGFRRSDDGRIDQRVVAPLAMMRAQDEGRAPKFERPRAISSLEGPLGPWAEVEEWTAR